MNFRSPSEFRFAKQLSALATALLILAGMILLFVSASPSQQPPRPPAWSVQSADPAHSSLTLKGSVILGIDTGMFYIVQFRIQGSSGNQLAGFQPSMPVTLESSGPKLQTSPALGAKSGGKVQPKANLGAKSPTANTVFTGIPTVGQALLIQASGLSPLEGVVASVTGPQSYTAGPPGPACCAVTAFNSQSGAVRAKVNTSGQIFMFQAPQAPPHEGPPPQFPSYQHINVGQPVWANLTIGQVSLDGKTVCCQITAEGTSLSGTGGKGVPAAIMNPGAKNPACCEITALNQQAKTASAKVKSNGQAFQIAVANPRLFQSLRVGQAIWANFKTRQVSLNGAGPVDGIQIVGGSIIAHGPGVTVAGKKPPYTAIPSPNFPPLTIHDHTLIMQAVIQNRVYLKNGISRHNWQHATRRQIAMAAMLYLIKASAVPEPTKERVRVAFQTMRRVRFNAPFAADLAFRKEAAAALGTANDPSSAVQTLSILQQKYASQSKYSTALDLAKTLVSDGASTIYSQTWLATNVQRPTSGGLVNYDIPLACGSGGPPDPSGVDSSDLGTGCFSGGCDPFTDPTCGQPPCDPTTDPTCGQPPCDPATDPSCAPPPPPVDCTTDPTNPDCPPPPPDCITDPSNPACPPPPPPKCPDPTQTYPNCSPQPTCPDPTETYPNCSPRPGQNCLSPTTPGCSMDPDLYGCLQGTGETTVEIVNGKVVKETITGGYFSKNGVPNPWCAVNGLIYSIWAAL